MSKFDEDNQTGKNHSGPHPNSPTKFLTATSIIGDKVVNLQGDKLGSINDLMIDLQFGKIEYVVIELGGFLGIGEKFFAIPFHMLTLDARNQKFILNQLKETLERAPGFDKDHWPETNIHLYESANVYWGEFMGVNTAASPY